MSAPLPVDSLDRAGWLAALSRLAESLSQPARLTVIGSVVGILSGQAARTTVDLDVWRRTSVFDADDLAAACLAAGMALDPKTELPESPYIQLISPGLVQLGPLVEAELEVLHACGPRNRLVLLRPPAEHLIASKLLRCNPVDLEDIQHLLATYDPDPARIRQLIESFPARRRAVALENLVYLRIFPRGAGEGVGAAPQP